MAKDKNSGDKIPTTNSIFTIVSTQFSDINQVVNAISGSMVKAADIAKIKIGIKSTKLAVKQIFKGYLEIKAYLESQKINETIELVNNLVSDPIKFMRMIKDPNKPTIQETQNKENLALFENFVSMLNYIVMISEYSNKVSFVGLLILPKRVNFAMNAIISSFALIQRKSKRIGLIAESVSNFVVKVPDMFKVLLSMNENLNMFVEASKKVTKKEAKKSIRQFFLMYFYVAKELFKLGKFIITGEYEAEEDKWFGLRTKTTTYKFDKSIVAKSLVYGAAYMGLATGVISAMKVTSDMISGISKNSKKVIKGLKALDMILFGHPDKDDKKRIKGLITIISIIGINHRKTPYFKALGFISLITIFVVETTAISLLMSVIGDNRKIIERGLESLDLMLFGSHNKKGKEKIKGLRVIIGILGGQVDFDNIFSATRAIIYLALVNVVMAEVSVISMLLSEIGDSSKNIKKGLKTISVIFFGKDHFLLDGKSVEGIIGIIQSVTNEENIIKDALKFTAYNIILAVSLTIFMKTANILFSIGTLRKKIKLGLNTSSYVFFGTLGPNQKYTDAKSKSKLGIVQLIQAVTNQVTLGEILGFTLFSITVSISFKEFQNVIDTLVELGKHKRKIVKGIQVLNVVLFGKDGEKESFPGIVEIIKDERLKDLSIKEVATTGAKLFLISLAFFSVGTLVGILGIFAIGSFLATISIEFINISIQKMLDGLKIVENTKINVIQSSLALEKMTFAYRSLAEGIQNIGQIIKPEDLLKATAFILISPIIIYIIRFCIQPMGDPKIAIIVTNGSKSLALLSGAYSAFALALMGISASVSKTNFALIISFIMTVGMMGLLIAGLGYMSVPILLGCIAMFNMSLALIVFSAALVVLSLAIVVFALSFQVLRLVIPSDDVIDEVVTSLVSMIQGIGKILRALAANIDLKTAFVGVISLGLVTIIITLLTINSLLFIILGFTCSVITPEMVQSVIDFVHNQATISREIATNFSLKDMILALIASAFYMVITALLTVNAILSLILYGITSVIDYTAFRRNLGLDGKNGLIPVIGDSIKLIDESIDGKAIFKSVFKMTGVMVIMTIISGIATCVKGLASLEIREYDDDGHPTGKKVKMQKSDFDSAKENIENLVTTVVSIFFDKDGKPTKTMELIKSIKRKVVMQTIGLKIILASISSMAKVVANMSKLVVPDEEKGFNDKGKPLGWRQLSKGDFEKFKENTSKLAGVITSLFDDNTPEGTSFTNALDRVKISSVIKMKLIGSIIKTFGNMAGTISKMAQLLVPDTTQDNWMNKDGKIVKWRHLTNEDIDNASTNIERLMTIFGTIIDKIKDSDLENIKMRTLKKFERVMSGISPITDLVNTVIKLATNQFPMIKLINGEPEKDSNGSIKMVYKSFDEIPFDNAIKNIRTILIKYLDGIGSIFEDEYYQHRVSYINKYMKEGIATGGISDIVDQVIKLATGQFPLMVLDNATGEPLKDKNGNIRMKYVTLDNSMISKATSNIGSIISNYVDSLSTVINAPNGDFVNKLNDINAAFTGSSGVFSLLTPMIDNITKINDLGDKAISSFTKNLQNIVYGYNNAIISINDNIDNYSTWNTIKDTFNDFVYTSSHLYSELKDESIPTNVERTVKATNDFLSKVNTINDSKLGKMADISQNMATFATKINGNFDGLAKAMNENIITALDKVDKALTELKETLSTLPDDVGSAVKNGIPNEIKITDSNPPKPNGPVKDASKTKDVAPSGKPQDDNRKDRNLYNLIDELMSCIEGQKSIRTRNVK